MRCWVCVETEETNERQYRLKKECVRCEVCVETEEAADQEYGLRDTVFTVRYALRSRKQLIKSIG